MRKRRVTAALFFQLGLAFGLAGSAFAQDKCQAPIATYNVRNIDIDTFSVEASINKPTSRFDVFAFPIKERPEGQSESILFLQGYAQNGDPVDLHYVGEGGWETDEGKYVSRITYQVRADHDEVDWGKDAPGKDEVATRFDETYFFVGHAFFVINYDWPACPIEVDFELSEEWIITSPWKMTGRTAIAANPWNLGQNAFAMGLDEPRTAELSGLDITWLISSDAKEIEGRINELMDVIPRTYIDFFGSAPGNRYATYFFTDYMSDGGAFENSFAMRIAKPISPADEIVWSHTLGHEIMHLWNGAGAIQGKKPDQTYWFTEGFTDYLTIKLMRKAGLIDDNMLMQRIANVLRRYEIAKRRSPNVTLADAGKSKGANWELIYGGGALAALILDAEASKQGTNTFRDAMRDLYEHSDNPYELDDLMERLDRSTNGKASQIVTWVNSSPSANDIRQRLIPLGIDSTTFRFDEVYVVFLECGKNSCAPDFLAGL